MAKGKGFVPFGKGGAKGKPAVDDAGGKGFPPKGKPKGNPFANMKKGK